MEQQALQRLLLNTSATQLGAARLTTYHLCRRLQELGVTKSPPDQKDLAIALSELQLIQQAISDTADAAMCEAVWTNLVSAVHERGQDAPSLPFLTLQMCICAE